MHSLTITSDHHTGNTTALWPRGVTLPDGGTYVLSDTQRWLLDLWHRTWDEIEKFTKPADRKLWILNGDLVDFDMKDRTNQHITKDLYTVIQAGATLLEPGLARVDEVHFVSGTDAHTGKDGEYEEMLAQDATIAVRNRDGRALWSQVLLVIDRLRVDAAHEVGMGNIPRTMANAANVLAADTMLNYAMRDQPAPHLVIRSHVHKYADSGANYPTRAIITPAWTSRANYSKRRPNRLADVGTISLLIEGDKVIDECHWITKLDSQRLWTRRV